MSYTVYCDVCPARAEKKLGRIAPADWFFAEVKLDPDVEPGEVVVVYACSRECALLFWNRGPGILTGSKQAHGTAKIKREPK